MNTDEIVKALLTECEDCSERDGQGGCGAVIYCPNRDAADLIEGLTAQLSAYQARERAAVEDIKHLVFECTDSPCDLCFEVCANYNGTCVAGVLAGFSDKCNGYERRGQQEAGEGGINRYFDLSDAALDDAARQWCDFIDSCPERKDGAGFAKFAREVYKSHIDN